MSTNERGSKLNRSLVIAVFVMLFALLGTPACRQSEVELEAWDLDGGPITFANRSFDDLEMQWLAPGKPISLSEWESEILSKAIAIGVKKAWIDRCLVLTMQARPLRLGDLFALKSRNPAVEFLASGPFCYRQGVRTIQFDFPLGEHPGQRKVRLFVSTDELDTVQTLEFLARSGDTDWTVEYRGQSVMSLYKSH